MFFIFENNNIKLSKFKNTSPKDHLVIFCSVYIFIVKFSELFKTSYISINYDY